MAPPRIVLVVAIVGGVASGCKRAMPTATDASLKMYNDPVSTSANPGATNAVALTYKIRPTERRHLCSGAVLALASPAGAPPKLAVVTAAHCLVNSSAFAVHLGLHVAVRPAGPADMQPPDQFSEALGLSEPPIFGGMVDLSSPASLTVASPPVAHPSYTDEASNADAETNFDLALVAIPGLPTGAGYRALRAVATLADLKRATAYEISGYGLTETGKGGEQRTAVIDTVEVKDEGAVHALLVVTTKRGYTAACQGDSGGPLYAKIDGEWRIAGVTKGNIPSLTPEAFKRGPVAQPPRPDLAEGGLGDTSGSGDNPAFGASAAPAQQNDYRTQLVPNLDCANTQRTVYTFIGTRLDENGHWLGVAR